MFDYAVSVIKCNCVPSAQQLLTELIEGPYTSPHPASSRALLLSDVITAAGVGQIVTAAFLRALLRQLLGHI